MAKSILEVVTLTSVLNIKQSDDLAYKLCEHILETQSSCTATWLARGVEDSNLLMIFSEHSPEKWAADNSSPDAKCNTRHAYYTDLLSPESHFGTLTTKPFKLRHVPILPQTLTSVISHPDEGTLKLTNVHFVPEISAQIQDKWDALNAKHEREGFQPWEGYLASTWGWATETEAYKDVGQTKVWVSLWSWVSMENHLRFMKAPAFERLMGDIHEFEGMGLRGVDIWHAHVTCGPWKK